MPDIPPSGLHAALDLPPHASPQSVKARYEAQMTAAVRAHDHQGALSLSRAFDAAPVHLRRAIYPTTAGDLPRRGSRQASSAWREWPTTAGRPVPVPALGPRRRGRATRTVLFALVVPLAVFGGVANYLKGHPASAPVVPVVNPTVVRAVPWQVPAAAAVGTDGLVEISCPAADGSTLVARVAPGATVQCPNGADPRITGA